MIQLAGKIFERYGKERTLSFLFIAISLIVFFPTLFGIPFWDDWVFVFRNGYFFSQSFLTYFPGGSQSRSWPVFYTFIWFMLKIFNEHYFFYHLFSLVLHGINGFLIWKILDKLKIKFPIWLALLFIIHPLQLFTVAWIIQFKTTLSLFFFLISAIFLINFYDDEKNHSFFFAIIFYTLSLLSKSTTVCFLLAVPFIYSPFKKKFGFKKILILSSPLLFIAASVIIRTAWFFHFRELAPDFVAKYSPESIGKYAFKFQNTTTLFRQFSATDNILFSIKNLIRYVYFLVFPKDNTLFPDKTFLHLDSFEFLYIFIGIFLLTLIFLDLKKRKEKILIAFYCFFLVSIIPFCGMIFIPIFNFSNFNPYWLSLPFLGVLPLISHYVKKKYLIVLLVTFYAFIGHFQSYQFLHVDQFFLNRIKKNPEEKLYYVGLVEHYIYMSDCDSAQKTLDLLPYEARQAEFALITKIHRCQTGYIYKTYR